MKTWVFSFMVFLLIADHSAASSEVADIIISQANSAATPAREKAAGGELVNLFDSYPELAAEPPREKGQISPDKTQTNNISLEGAYSYQTLSSSTQVQINVTRIQNRRSSGTSGTLRLELWALASPYNGGSFSGIRMATSQLGQLQAGFYYENIQRTVAFQRPTQAGTYYVVLMVTEFSSSQPLNDGFSTADWGNFSNTLVVSGPPAGGDLDLVTPWSYQISNGNARVTATRIQNNRANGTSGSLRLELWATASAYNGGSFSGYKIAQSSFNPLQAGFNYSPIDFTQTASIPPNGTWYITLMLTEFSSSTTTNNGYGVVDYSQASQTWVIGTTPPPPTASVLQNNVPIGSLSGAAGAQINFTVSVPAGASNLIIETYNGTGDADLYVRFGSPVTATASDCSSLSLTTIERCTFATPAAGTYYVQVYGYSAFSGVTVTARWTTTTVPPPSSLTVVEYYSAQLNHYFMASAPAEQAYLDAGNVIDFRRTGLQFRAYGLGTAGTAAVCRFYSQTVNSHFYTASSAECNLVNTTMPIWRYERNEFAIGLPSGPGCPSGTTPVYRNYNNRVNDYNHRFTTSVSTYNSMVAAGWVGEGIVMCAPL